jgi:hypothetical protein
VAGVASFQPKNILDLSRAQSGAAQIDLKLKECLVPAFGWGTVPLSDRCGLTPRRIVGHLRCLPYRDHLSHLSELRISPAPVGATTLGDSRFRRLWAQRLRGVTTPLHSLKCATPLQQTARVKLIGALHGRDGVGPAVADDSHLRVSQASLTTQ